MRSAVDELVHDALLAHRPGDEHDLHVGRLAGDEVALVIVLQLTPADSAGQHRHVVDADAAVCMGPGLRWDLMGPNLVYHLGGGPGGIRHFLEHFTGVMTACWEDLGSPPNMGGDKARVSRGGGRGRFNVLSR
jgi:hypothetical protein